MANHTILLIDYEPRSIKCIRQPLEKAGYEVAVATDGPSGLEAFRTIKPDLTLVEAMLPKMHGFEVCKELKKSEHGQRSAVLILTSVYKGRKYRNQARHLYNCDEYLEKPISDEDLLGCIQKVLQKPVAPTAEAAPPAAPSAGAESQSSKDVEDEISSHLDSIFS